MKHYFASIIACSMLLLTSSSCSQQKEIENVHLTLANDIAPTEILNEQITKFKQQYSSEVNLTYTIIDQAENDILKAPRSASDIFNIANDQVDELYKIGALLEITENTESIINAAGGANSAAADVVTRDGKIYGYPLSSGNGYFLYYNNAYLTESDVQSLDQILAVCAKNGKKFTMDFSSGWYLFSFFRGAGLNLEYNEAKAANLCNWNATDTPHTGLSVAESVLNIAGHDGFIYLPNDQFVEHAQTDEVIAGVSGQWHAEELSQVWGEHYAADKLPTYTINGEQIQMASFTGYRIVGINAYTQNPKWAMRLAEYLTNEETQLKRFEAIGQCPANITAANSEEVQASPAVAATAKQAPFAYIQHVADPFWNASSEFGLAIANGDADKNNLQDMLDKMVSQIIIPVKKN